MKHIKLNLATLTSKNIADINSQSLRLIDANDAKNAKGTRIGSNAKSVTLSDAENVAGQSDATKMAYKLRAALTLIVAACEAKTAVVKTAPVNGRARKVKTNTVAPTMSK